MIVVRDARTDDEPAIIELSSAAFEELRRIYLPSPVAIAGKTALDSTLTRIVAVDAHDRILGTVQSRIEASRLHLLGLAVHPAHRRLGIARQLIDHLAAIARRRTLDVLSLYTVKETGNPAVFERLGFRTIREEVDGWSIGAEGQPMTEVYMERDASR